MAGVGNYLSHAGDLYDITRPSDERLANAKPGTRNYKPMLYAGEWTRLDIERANQRELDSFCQPVLTPDVMYESDGSINTVSAESDRHGAWPCATTPSADARVYSRVSAFMWVFFALVVPLPSQLRETPFQLGDLFVDRGK